MVTTAQQATDFLRNIPFVEELQPEQVAALAPYIEMRKLKAGELLYKTGQSAETVWLLVRGKLDIDNGKSNTEPVVEGLLGEEAVIGSPTYLSNVVAHEDSLLYSVPGRLLLQVMGEMDDSAYFFRTSLLTRYSQGRFSAPIRRKKSMMKSSGLGRWRVCSGWLLAILVPVGILTWNQRAVLDWAPRQLSAALASAAVMWVFGLTEPYVAALFPVLMCVMLGVVPTAVIMSGFTSNAFFMALSVFGIGAVIIRSGIFRRAVLIVLKRCPENELLYNLCIQLMGTLLTPFLPSVRSRAGILAPLTRELGQQLGYEARSRDFTQLSMSAFGGVTLLSPVLLTSSPLNLALFGMLPEQYETTFNWLYWLTSGAVVAVMVFTGFTVVSSLMSLNRDEAKPARTGIEIQLNLLGPMKIIEWMALVGVIMFMLTFMSDRLIKTDHRLVALTILGAYLVVDALDKDRINTRIDWSFLMLLGFLIGLVAAIENSGLVVKVLKADLIWLRACMDLISEHPRAFLVLVMLLVFVLGLFVPQASALVAVPLLPVAQVGGFNPWVLIFVLLVMSDCWILRSQSSIYADFRQAMSDPRDPLNQNTLFDEARFLRMNLASVVLRMLAIIMSIPYWEAMRLL